MTERSRLLDDLSSESDSDGDSREARMREKSTPMKKKSKRFRQISIIRSDPPDLVGQQISDYLEEENSDLILKLVNVIGSVRAVRLYEETRRVLSGGGLLTSDGKRKKTPGGTYLALFRSSADSTEEEKTEVFADYKRKSKIEAKVKRKERTRRQKEKALKANNKKK